MRHGIGHELRDGQDQQKDPRTDGEELPRHDHEPAAAILGTLFGALNAVTGLVLAPQSWWMGVLHLPLLACSALLVATSWTDARSPAPRCEDVPEQSHPSPIK